MATSRYKALGIAGRARRNGNAYSLVQQVPAGSAAEAAQGKVVLPSEPSIVHCRHYSMIGKGQALDIAHAGELLSSGIQTSGAVPEYPAWSE